MICTRCIMDTSDPGIAFDAQGVCNHCRRYDRMVREHVHSGDDGRRRLGAIVERIRREGDGKPHDCVIGVSGGVDSTFVAWQVRELGLRPLAVHLDNGWDTEIAVSNISTALRRLNIDLHTEVLDWEEFRDIQLAFLRASVPDAEVPSDHAIFACLYRTATRFGVRHVITGLNIRTETHLPPAWSRGHFDFGYIKSVHSRFGSRPIRTFPHYSFIEYVTSFSRTHETLNVLDYVDYSKKAALARLQAELGWRDYGGKHCESVYTRWYQGVYLPRKFGYDKRRSHLSSRVCSGEVTREQALADIQRPPYDAVLQEEDCIYVAKKLGISRGELDALIAAPPRRFEEFDSYEKRASSPWFSLLRRGYRAARRVVRPPQAEPVTG
jgi:N-acetyl sugar amidotransferase